MTFVPSLPALARRRIATAFIVVAAFAACILTAAVRAPEASAAKRWYWSEARAEAALQGHVDGRAFPIAGIYGTPTCNGRGASRDGYLYRRFKCVYPLECTDEYDEPTSETTHVYLRVTGRRSWTYYGENYC